MLSWASDISGPLGTGSNLWLSLPAGSHTITLTAKDSLGQTGTDSILVTLNAGAGYPTAEILSPADNTVFDLGQPVLLQGRGLDPEDGPLPESSLRWISDRDGAVGLRLITPSHAQREQVRYDLAYDHA